jgi:hypothetical protein
MHSPVLASIVLDADSLNEGINGDLLYLSGNIELLVGDALTLVGQYPGALLLLPSIEALAAGMTRMREGHKTIEVVLVGDTTSLWIMARSRHSDGAVSLAYRSAETTLMLRDDLEKALGDAVQAFLEVILARRPASTWGASAMQIVESIAHVWPEAVRRIRSDAR